MTTINNVSDTSFVVARIRERESQRPDRHFNDSLAAALAGDRAEKIAAAAQKNWLTRILSQTLNTAIIVRTVLMDELIEKAVRESDQEPAIKCVVNLGAGLDTRPYRLTLPSDLLWIEVDLPHIIHYKTPITQSQTPRCQLQRHGLDLQDRRATKNFLASLDQNLPTLILTEGLLLYLSENEVVHLAYDLRQCPQVLRWVTDLNSPKTLKTMALIWRHLLGRQVEFKFGHDNAGIFFPQQAWTLRQEMPSFLHSERLNRQSPLAPVRKFLGAFLGTSFDQRIRSSSVVLELEPRRPLQ